MRRALGRLFCTKMELMQNCSAKSQTPSNPDGSAEVSESTPMTQRATPSPDAAVSNSILSLSETEGSFPGDEVRDRSCLPLNSEEQSERRNALHTPLSRVSDTHPPVPPNSLDALQNNIALQRKRLQRKCRASGARNARADSSTGLTPDEAASLERQLRFEEMHSSSALPPINSEIKNDAHSSSAPCESGNIGMAKEAVCEDGAGDTRNNQNVHHEGASGWQESPQCTQSSTGLTSLQMVKSVSPAGVVRIGGRNRRKRTKYDLAYKQMEELGPFEEEAKSVDLSKVPGSSFVSELLRNPQQYSHDSWVYGFSWPVGADGRRLLLRKLRGVYWSDPEKWQRVLQENNLYRRDLFTLATVQELFKVTHLMGAEVWDFLLKCTALTQKCDALSSKDPDICEEEAAEVSGPTGTPQRVPQQQVGTAGKSEDEYHTTSDKFFGNGLPCSGFLRKRVTCEGRDEKVVSKRSRGRPRKSHLKVQDRSSGLDQGVRTQGANEMQNIAAVPLGDAASTFSGTGTSLHAKSEPFSLLRSSTGDALESRRLIMDNQSSTNQGDDMNIFERQRRVTSLLRTAAPLSRSDRCYQALPLTKVSTPGAERVLGGGRSNNSLLKLTAHYTFMAQFMQCCMLVEVQRTLLRLAEEFKPTQTSEKDMSDSSPEIEVKHSDPTAQACFESLLRSSNVHMEFVEVIVQQLRRQAGNSNACAVPEGQHVTHSLSDDRHANIQHPRPHVQKRLSPVASAEAHRGAGVTGEFLQALRELCQSHPELCANPVGEDGRANERIRSNEITAESEVTVNACQVQCENGAPAGSRHDGSPC